MEGSLVAYKVFTNGSTLQASELNENLMQQSTAVFSNAAARTAAITSPVEGQLTYLEDVDRYEWWSGSAWRSPFGMTHINTTTFTAQTSVSFNNVFTSAYENYLIKANLTQSVDGLQIEFRFRASGTDFTGANYNVQNLGVFGTTANNFQSLNATSGVASQIHEANVQSPFSLDVFSPFTSNSWKTTFGTRIGKHPSVGTILGNTGTIVNSSTAFDGITIFTVNGNLTGTIRIYGLRN
jgi:hypothetical protein